MATSNKSKKILEKARKIAAKTKKKKVSKVDVKKKTTSYPEGQNAPQSKKYTQENDKALPAKATGWRWTKEGAKKLGKSVESKPTTSDIEKYRNETFKLKGKPNKSGPKGVGDGSHRYLYVERRADKADITRKNKLAKGGAIWVEIRDDFEEDGVTYIDAFTTSDDNEEGKVIAKVKSNGEVIYLDDRAKTDSLAQEVINDVKKRKKEDGGEMAKGGKTKKFLTYYEVYDENTDKTLNIQAYSFEEAEEIASTIEYDNFKDGEDIEYGEMARGGKIPSSEVADFKKYVKSNYGKDEIWSEFFPPVGVSNEEINHAVSQYIDYCKTKDDQWGGGDTFDREIVRDIMLYNRGTKKGLEYQRAIKEIFGKDKKEYGGILQPMIGGVNADPRFDIYNTTMFAEKGAEVPKGAWGVFYNGKLMFTESSQDDAHKSAKMMKSEVDMPFAVSVKEIENDEYAKGGKTKKAKVEKVDNSSLVRYAQTNDQVKVLTDIIPTLNKKGIKLTYGTSIGKSPQTIIFDKDYHDGILYISPDGWYGTNTYHDEEFSDADDLEYVIDNPSDDDEYAKGGEIQKGDVYKAVGEKWGVFLRKPSKDIQKLLNVNGKTSKKELRLLLPTILKVSDSLYDYVKPDSISGDFGIDPFEYHLKLSNVLVDMGILKSQEEIDEENDDEYANGGKLKVVPIYLYEVTYSKHGKKGTFVSKVKAKSEEDAINKWIDETNRTEGVYTIIDVVKSTRTRMEDGGEMAHGGATHEQGYDDREDESLAMRHGKIASKDFVGTHKRKEHSRRDDARFEERHKKAYGGTTDASIELLD